ncbi:MAG: hypothetical protein A3G52_01745 [Candidatus Taylorbacteria bacterium RIFCSPLOWO2_12_FULL_43_20]|uniref:Uncharacterized protein n=1 Tax=Candidatus Taylorbacteria bacterium RIFCSPLOWO2_12_FULL_43_20 TaxID=1802332 RepID=A0A1G2P0Z9_9BACT|nr:MAG: hypothetical protein A3B98_00230 [Candidatus Taylorbacteria bacterium RIFCSPHIGHO2_02_FULL_43_55]OHA29926.1 MAG: hypothetical protein A3E92_03860 [Candidatus Taylorbacteria bacterium RIFCSPHIGHO2_12_FULL_42_34]OHA38390.1 MAG: hypothetical protein A3H58_04285 [Candidatus Taylorbacteria bacterium RIFCSPLOWO2_02_FULL_43_22b]OHA41998.1 MAG: hypothetical protein A3G52_01745 [Candidatus Taylorbacteria bacterium RIFCSPLOWO2_12_FULL_43_20]
MKGGRREEWKRKRGEIIQPPAVALRMNHMINQVINHMILNLSGMRGWALSRALRYLLTRPSNPLTVTLFSFRHSREGGNPDSNSA